MINLKKNVMDYLPWLPYPCIEFLEKHLNENMQGIEYGSGGSTIYFAKRTKGLISIEHNLFVYNKLSNLLSYFKILNCRLIIEQGKRIYPRIILPFKDNIFDYILVDGIERVECVEISMSKLKPGGILILDNSERREYAPAIKQLKDWFWYMFQPDGNEIEQGEPGWKCTVFKKPGGPK